MIERSLRGVLWALLAFAAVVGVAGCGLKGPLTLPEKSKNVVIRPGQTGTGTQPAGGTPGTTTTEEPEKLPPPELPRTNANTGRG